MNEAETMSRALELLRNRGWIKGSAATREGICAGYAITFACGAGKGDFALALCEDYLSVARELFPDHPTTHMAWYRVFHFNDWPDTTREMVEQVFEKCILRAEESEASR